jgi:hypothetical protein
MTTERYSAQTLRDYLLGQLPDAEAERLDELSITDDELAERLGAVEHDLVDAFARGELEDAAVAPFRSRYLTTPRGREAVRFAEALQSLDTPAVDRRRWWGALALAAGIALAVASVWLTLDNRALRARATGAESARDALQRDLREASAKPPPGTAPAPEIATPPSLTVATLVLAPPLRSAQRWPTVAVTGDTRELPVQLELEPVDYPSYDAALVAANGSRVLWRAVRRTARVARGRTTLDLRLPATVLAPQDYLIRVSGVPARGTPEIVGEYRFTIAK